MVGDERLAAVVARFGSPAYVLDLADVRRAHADLRRALPARADLGYSVKANPNPAVVAELASLGCWCEVSSPDEIDIARTAGAPAERLLYTGPGKAERDVRAALRAGIRWYSVESYREFEVLTAQPGGDEALLLPRLRLERPPPAAVVMSAGQGHFGMPAEEFAAIAAAAGTGRVRGLHWFVASNVTDAAVLAALFRAEIEASAALARPVPHMLLALGGGFPHPMGRPRPALPGGLAGEVERALRESWHRPPDTLLFESGRYLVNGCGTLLCTVLDVKLRGGRHVAVLDAGIHVLGGMAALGRALRSPLAPRLLARGDGSATTAYDLVGPLCTPMDTLARGVPLPPLRPGDLLAIPDVGAYGQTASLTGFLSRGGAVEVVLDDDRVVHASRVTVARIEA
jgi:diaminopimelate decarboxylase